MMNRAYSVLQVKEIIERSDDYLVKGMASTPATDRTEDVVEPLGAVYRLPLPVLWQHRSAEAIGRVISAKKMKTGIPVEISIPKVAEAGRLKDRIDEALHSIKYRLVTGLSIGFRALKDGVESIKDGGFRFTSWEWLELSLVTIPANAEATIQTVKSLDIELRAASGQAQDDVELPKPGVAGKAVKLKPDAPKDARKVKKTIAEQISAFEATRQAKAARMDELMDAVAEKGETLDAAGKEDYDTLAGEVKEVDEHLVRLRAREESNKKAAKVIEAATAEEASISRAGPVVTSMKSNVPPGIGFIRVLGAKYLGRMNHQSPADIAKAMWPDTPEVEMVLRAPVAAGTTVGTTWAAPLVVAQNMASEFAALLAPETIIGRIPGITRVPFNISVPREVTGASVNWVGEGKIKPVSAMAFDSITLAFNKVAGIVPITQELMRFSSPAAEGLIRNSLIKAVAYLTDRDFLDPAKAAQVGVSPASITNGVTAIASTGVTADAFRADLGSLLDAYYAANMSTSGLVLVMTSRQAARLGMMRNTLGQKEFDGLGPNGGSVEMIPVITSENIVGAGGSPTDGNIIVAINAPDILLADDGGVAIDISTEASIQMDSAPDSPATASTVTVSAFQYNMVFIRAERFITWTKRRAGAVQYLNYTKYA